LARRLPQRRVALEGGIRRLQIVIRDGAEHVIRRIVVLLHPGVDVIAAFDLPFVYVMRVTKSFQLLGDPERPVAVAARVADENIGHAAKPRSRTVQLRQGVFSSWFERYARQGCPRLALSGGPRYLCTHAADEAKIE